MSTPSAATGGMSFAEAITDRVLVEILAKVSLEIGAAEKFPEQITVAELESIAAWAGTTVEEILVEARAATGAESDQLVPCTECRRRAEAELSDVEYALIEARRRGIAVEDVATEVMGDE
ncbi:hypothetical protein [Tomitella fengzijianii]|uniref:Uncharacterized protein n=1 Tax=Tomitella fengzijianii TaxID=2597660 RepID=A0A516X4Y2_9ACTN|nr:hypothetical protein [Tomitella fengzijianii]QDQ98110.1 hypothetical protein FO059_13300 [Tomitella fengzijianii]